VAKGMDLPALDRGKLRHPLFGDREHWYEQKVRKGWWTKSLTKAANTRVRKELVGAVERTLRSLEK